MNDPVMLRGYVREVMAFAPKRKFTERMIFDAVRRLAREELQVDELKAALQWNLSRDYITSTHDDDENADVWTLTAKGRAKEGIA